MTASSDKGPNPKAGTVEQNIAVTGAFIALAKCKGALSLTKFIFASRISTADSRKDNFPHKLIEFVCPELTIICSAVAKSFFDPKK